MNRVTRTGPPEPIEVEPAPPVCASCGAVLVRDNRWGRQVVLVCPTNCKRAVRMDGPARSSPRDALDARRSMAEIASRAR